MALKLPKLDFFSRLDARSRVFFLLIVVLAFIFLIYLAVRYFGGPSTTVGPTRVASAPNVSFVPGATESAEYQRAIQAANLARANQAMTSSQSAVATIEKLPTPQAGLSPTGQCNIICPEEAANVKYDLQNWVRNGTVSPDVASELEKLADQNVPVDQYAAELARLVKEGKLTPEQARELLERYKQQHADALLQQSAAAMDKMIAAGQLPLGTANDLLAMQKRNASAAEYAAALDKLVHDGVLTPEAAQQLLAQMTQQCQQELAKAGLEQLHQLRVSGGITADVEQDLAGLQNSSVPFDQYSAELTKLTSSGKLVPATATKLLNQYRDQKSNACSASMINQLIKQAEAAMFGEIADLQKSGQITPAVATELTDAVNKNISLTDFQAMLVQMVKDKKISPQIAQLKMGDYQKIKVLRDEAEKLAQMRANNLPAAAYMDELRRAVQNGTLTPAQAAQLAQEYQALLAAPAAAVPAAGNVAGGAQLTQLQQRFQQAQGAQAPTAPTAEQFAPPPQPPPPEVQQPPQDLSGLISAMSGQAQSLVNAWQPNVMEHKEGTLAAEATAKAAQLTAVGPVGAAGPKGPPPALLANNVLIKAGTILFAVLDTGVNSDYPDTPVMATIVMGPFKGAKLLGKLNVTTSPTGQMDRVTLTFNMMNTESWTTSKSINAFAIDPDTARTVLASHVDYHYLTKYGALMASAFVSGYAGAISNSGGTTTTGIFGTSTQSATLSPGNKLAVGIGQIGTAFNSVLQNYTNIPPTVLVDSGVGLGILFMSDLTG